jgi:hypothetical protein
METLQALETAVGLTPTPASAEEPLRVYECIYVGNPRKQQPLNADGDGDGAPLVNSESESDASKSNAAGTFGSLLPRSTCAVGSTLHSTLQRGGGRSQLLTSSPTFII